MSEGVRQKKKKSERETEHIYVWIRHKCVMYDRNTKKQNGRANEQDSLVMMMLWPKSEWKVLRSKVWRRMNRTHRKTMLTQISSAIYWQVTSTHLIRASSYSQLSDTNKHNRKKTLDLYRTKKGVSEWVSDSNLENGACFFFFSFTSSFFSCCCQIKKATTTAINQTVVVVIAFSGRFVCEELARNKKMKRT